jgi:hypothetical protein
LRLTILGPLQPDSPYRPWAEEPLTKLYTVKETSLSKYLQFIFAAK